MFTVNVKIQVSGRLTTNDFKSHLSYIEYLLMGTNGDEGISTEDLNEARQEVEHLMDAVYGDRESVKHVKTLTREFMS